MKKFSILCITLLFIAPMVSVAADDFLTNPSLLRSDEHFGADKVYFPDDILEQLKKYDSIMVDEPEIFIAADSPYSGFKGSDMAALSDMLRKSFIQGVTTEPVSIGNFKAADEPGPSVLYLRMALKNVYIKKKKRGLLTYTPVGAVAKGIHDVASEAIDKSTLVEMTLEAEMHDSTTSNTLFMIDMERGQRKAHHQKEDAAEWEMTGVLAEELGRRLACRLDNARLPDEQKRDCLKAIPLDQ